MTSFVINKAYINAMLADAAYSDVTRNMSSADMTSALRDRMTPAQAAYIAANFEVLSTANSSDIPLVGSGFDATVWRGKADGEYANEVYVSMRGTKITDGGADVVADARLASSGVAHEQIRDMVNWWLRATTLLGQTTAQIATRETSSNGPITLFEFVAADSSAEGTGELVGVDSIAAVNGHSLGGYLATAFTRLFGNRFGVQTVSTFNSAGFSNVAAANIQNRFDQIAELIGNHLGLGSLSAVAPKQTNYYAQNGWSATTNSWGEAGFLVPGFNQYGARTALYQEDGFTVNPFSNHSMYKLTDVLALGATLKKLAPAFDISQLNTLLKAGSNEKEASIEGVFDGLRRALDGPGVAASSVGDAGDSAATRVAYHAALAKLNEDHAGLAGQLTIQAATDNLRSLARNDFSALVALQDLSPIVVSEGGSGALASLWQSTRATA